MMVANKLDNWLDFVHSVAFFHLAFCFELLQYNLAGDSSAVPDRLELSPLNIVVGTTFLENMPAT